MKGRNAMRGQGVRVEAVCLALLLIVPAGPGATSSSDRAILRCTADPSRHRPGTARVIREQSEAQVRSCLHRAETASRRRPEFLPRRPTNICRFSLGRYAWETTYQRALVEQLASATSPAGCRPAANPAAKYAASLRRTNAALTSILQDATCRFDQRSDGPAMIAANSAKIATLDAQACTAPDSR